jgi:hypothetical protein
VKLTPVLSGLGFEHAREAIEPVWEESAASVPPDGPGFLQRDFVADACAYVGLTGEETDAALRAAGRMARDPHLAALAWHGHRRLYDGGPSIVKWPKLSADVLGEPGMFYVVALLSGYRRGREVHEGHSIPAGIVSDTLEDVGRHVREHARLHGHPGLTPVIVGGWLKYHLRGRLYRLRRLQFMPGTFPAVGPKTACLRPGDPVLEVHIPATGPLTPDAVTDSFGRAMAFFPRHFPDLPAARAFLCTTWMFDPQLAEYLDADSNILRFQRRFQLFPVECDGWSAVRSVFRVEIPYGHDGPVDLSDLPRSTGLQRALLDHLAAGKRWHKAGGFILAEDLR